MVTPWIEQKNKMMDAEVSKKYVITELPCLKTVQGELSVTRRNDNIHCVFLGALYSGLRPPESLISIISELRNNNIVFDFYGNGQQLIEQSSDYERARERINLFGQVSSADANRARAQADILVNIDNTSVELVPSKIFEYVGTGIPIINCYFSKDSQTLKYLERYPLHIDICLYDEPGTNAIRIDNFIRQLDDSRVPLNTVKKLYVKNTPEYVAKQCLEAYEEKMANK